MSEAGIKNFERNVCASFAFVGGIVLILLSLCGPLYLNIIRYRTHPLIINQLLGQDIVNIFPVSFLLIVGAILLFNKNCKGVYLLAFTPLFLFYYAISYAIGWEWMAPEYSGNSHLYFFYYLYILITGVIILLYSLANLPKDLHAGFRKIPLRVYSFLMVAFMLVFSKMWIDQVVELQVTGFTKAYDIAPAAFWLVRTIDLGFCVPLGFISVYLLWTAASKAFAIQFLFYGFFVTQILAVAAMGISMYVNNDPNISVGELGFFLALAMLLGAGFWYVMSGYRVKR